MIRLIDNNETLTKLTENLPQCHYTDNILYLAAVYGVDTRFCEFYDADGSLICIFESASAIVSDLPNANYEEIAMFISGCNLINAPHTFCENILPYLSGFENVPVDFQTSRISAPVTSDLNASPSLQTVFDIVSSGFSDIDFSLWYTDASHKIRHNLAKCYTYKNCASVTASNFNNGIFLSQVSTLPEHRKKGYAKEMLHEVASLYDGKTIYLIAEHSKRPFYKSSGFEITGIAGRLRRIEK